MTGTGPLGRAPAGSFNFEAPSPGDALYLEPTPKRIRAQVGDVTVADSRRAWMLHEAGQQPVYYFPAEDVRAELLSPSDRRTHCATKGEASYFTVTVGDRVLEAVAWTYAEPIPAAPPPFAGLIAFYFNRIDRWLEESEEISVHPRDPYHRIDVRASDRRVRISLDDVLLADTGRALALFESNLPTRWYLPAADVRVPLLPSETITHCPYKGAAQYHSLDLPGGTDLVWYYTEPLPEVAVIKDLVCFFNEKVDLELDGVAQERPQSPWKGRLHSDAAAVPVPNDDPAVTRG